MEVLIDKQLKEECNVNLGCIFYKTNVIKTNKELWEYIEKEVINNVKEMFNLENLTEQINIKTSRKAYKALGKEPSRYRVSSEALIRRILQGKGLYRINNVVDTNNLISIETGYSVGSYDLENLHGNINFRIGNIGEKYQGIGKEMINIENLPVFADDFGAYGSPTSDSTRAMITEKSKDILTVLISFNGMEGLEKSIDIAKKYLTKYAGAEDIRSIIAKSFNDFRRNGLENPNSIFYMGVDDSPKPMYKDVADIIHKSGGLVFLAHPFEYRFEDTIGFINELRKEIKLDGIECFHPSAEIDNRIDILIDYARKNNLYISGGSDFHGDKKPNNEIGKGSGSLNISKEYIEEWVE